MRLHIYKQNKSQKTVYHDMQLHINATNLRKQFNVPYSFTLIQVNSWYSTHLQINMNNMVHYGCILIQLSSYYRLIYIYILIFRNYTTKPSTAVALLGRSIILEIAIIMRLQLFQFYSEGLDLLKLAEFSQRMRLFRLFSLPAFSNNSKHRELQ